MQICRILANGAIIGQILNRGKNGRFYGLFWHGSRLRKGKRSQYRAYLPDGFDIPISGYLTEDT